MSRRHRLQIVARLGPRLPELTRTTVAAIQAAIPAYRDLNGSDLQQVTTITAWALSRFLDAWTGDSELAAADLARFRAIGAARAEDGRPLAAVLRAYRIAAVTGIEGVLDQAGPELEVADVRSLTKVVMTATDQLSEAVISGYTAALDRISGDRDRALADLLDDLLVGRQSSESTSAERGRQLGVTLPERPVLLVVEPVGSAPVPTPARLRSLLTDLAEVADLADLAVELPVDPIAHLPVSPDAPPRLVTQRGRRGVLLLAADAGAELEKAVRVWDWRGCLIRAGSSAELAGAYRLAADALDSAPGRAFVPRRILDEGDARLLALLRARPDAEPRTVVSTVLGVLTDAGHRHLLEGLVAYLDTGSASAAAERLHLHPQTLRYRLRRVGTLTGRDPLQPWHRFVLELATTLHAGIGGDLRQRADGGTATAPRAVADTLRVSRAAG